MLCPDIEESLRVQVCAAQRRDAITAAAIMDQFFMDLPWPCKLNTRGFAALWCLNTPEMKQPGVGREMHRGKVTSSEPDNSPLLRLLTFMIHAEIF